jgi:hypothetical protein
MASLQAGAASSSASSPWSQFTFSGPTQTYLVGTNGLARVHSGHVLHWLRWPRARLRRRQRQRAHELRRFKHEDRRPLFVAATTTTTTTRCLVTAATADIAARLQHKDFLCRSANDVLGYPHSLTRLHWRTQPEQDFSHRPPLTCLERGWYGQYGHGGDNNHERASGWSRQSSAVEESVWWLRCASHRQHTLGTHSISSNIAIPILAPRA